MGRGSKLPIPHRDAEAAEADRGKGWLLSLPNPFFLSALCVLCALCGGKASQLWAGERDGGIVEKDLGWLLGDVGRGTTYVPG